MVIKVPAVIRKPNSDQSSEEHVPATQPTDQPLAPIDLPVSDLPLPQAESNTMTAPAQTVAPPVPQPAVAVSKPAAIAESIFRRTTDIERELLEKLRKLTPSQRIQLRSMGTSEGLIPQRGSRRLPNGGMEITLEISPDDLPQLESWCEAAGKPLEEQAREIIGFLLSSYLHGEWSAPMPIEPAVPAAVPPAALPPAAATVTK